MSEYVEPLIDAERVGVILRDSLYTNEEVSDSEALTIEDLPAGAVTAKGILVTYAFHGERLESHREEIKTMLQNLPVEFRPHDIGGGGGWSFLNACQDANDVQWTGMHRTMEQLFCLGIALDMVQWLGGPDIWESFPGGMPYVLVKV